MAAKAMPLAAMYAADRPIATTPAAIEHTERKNMREEDLLEALSSASPEPFEDARDDALLEAAVAAGQDERWLQLVKLDEQVDVMREQLRESRSSSATLSKQLAVARSQLDASRASAATLSAQFSVLRSQLSVARSQLDASREALERLDAQVSLMRSQLDEERASSKSSDALAKWSLGVAAASFVAALMSLAFTAAAALAG